MIISVSCMPKTGSVSATDFCRNHTDAMSQLLTTHQRVMSSCVIAKATLINSDLTDL
jgi:hypothetical protein